MRDMIDRISAVISPMFFHGGGDLFGRGRLAASGFR